MAVLIPDCKAICFLSTDYVSEKSCFRNINHFCLILVLPNSGFVVIPSLFIIFYPNPPKGMYLFQVDVIIIDQENQNWRSRDRVKVRL